MFVIGLTGNSGSGKSSISEILRGEGAYIIDADDISRQILLPDGKAFAEVTGLFGDRILDSEGRIDRRVLGGIVFNDKASLERHVEITHRYIIAEIKDCLERMRALGCQLAVMDAPLLIEAGLHAISDCVWLVKAERSVSIERIINRDGIIRDMALKRLGVQMPPEELEKYADVIIENNGSLEELKQGVLHQLRMMKCFMR